MSVFDLNMAVSAVDENWEVRGARWQELQTFLLEQEPKVAQPSPPICTRPHPPIRTCALKGVLRADLTPDQVRVDQADILLLHRDVIASWISFSP